MNLADDVVVLQEVTVPGSDLVLRIAAPRNAGDKKRLDWGDVGSGGVLWDAAHILNALLVAHPALVVRAPRATLPSAFSLWYACGAELHRQPPAGDSRPDAQPFAARHGHSTRGARRYHRQRPQLAPTLLAAGGSSTGWWRSVGATRNEHVEANTMTQTPEVEAAAAAANRAAAEAAASPNPRKEPTTARS